MDISMDSMDISMDISMDSMDYKSGYAIQDGNKIPGRQRKVCHHEQVLVVSFKRIRGTINTYYRLRDKHG